MSRLLFHIDVNNAFLSWEALYRLHELKESQDLRLIPSIIGGSQENRHGIVLAKSTPAKKYGIRTAETIVSALKKYPNLLIVPPQHSVYAAYSKRFFKLLSEYTPDIEPCSIDEAFLDMTETCHLFGSPEETAHLIKNRIYNELGFTVNVGISINKILAKMASDFEKPNRVHTLFPEEVPAKMWPLPVSNLFFVGHSALQKLNLLGIYTIGELAHYDASIVNQHLGNKYGTLIHQYANGIGDDQLDIETTKNKGYGNSVTLPEDITTLDAAFQILLLLSETVGWRLRHNQVKCNCITVEIKNHNFISKSHQITLASPTDITNVIYEHSCQLLQQFWDGTPLRLLGIRTSKITEENYVQLSLFENEQTKKLEKLDNAIDAIRSKYGDTSITRASLINKKLLHKHDV